MDTMKTIEAARALILRDKSSRMLMYLTIRNGIVVGAMGSDPSRYMGLSEDQARKLAKTA